MGQMQIDVMTGDWASWSAWASWAEWPVSMQYDSMINNKLINNLRNSLTILLWYSDRRLKF